MLCPYFIFIVGCPAAGKSTLVQQICRAFTMFEFSTDLSAIEEIFLINDVIAECVRKRIPGQEIGKSFASVISRTRFWKDLLEKKLQELKLGRIKIDKLETKKTEDGGHHILEPYLWDEALYRSISGLRSDKCYIFEFSRGTDQEYIKKFRITPNEIYHRCFSIILHANPNVTVSNSLIIHVFADRAERERRNKLCKVQGKHFVSQQVMDEVYGCDIFCFEKYSRSKFPCGFLSHSLPIPVVSVDNTSPNPGRNFASVVKYLKLIVKSCN